MTNRHSEPTSPEPGAEPETTAETKPDTTAEAKPGGKPAGDQEKAGTTAAEDTAGTTAAAKDTAGTGGDTRPPAGTAPEPGGPGLRMFWLVPTLTFIAGLLLGGGVVAATNWNDNEQAAAPAPVQTTSPAPTPGPTSSDRVLVIPGSCVQGLDRAERALRTLRGGLEAAQNFDTARLQQVLDQLQQQQPDVSRLADECRQAAATTKIE